MRPRLPLGQMGPTVGHGEAVNAPLGHFAWDQHRWDPQGCVLGPVLFNVYQRQDTGLHGVLIKFGDDTERGGATEPPQGREASRADRRAGRAPLPAAGLGLGGAAWSRAANTPSRPDTARAAPRLYGAAPPQGAPSAPPSAPPGVALPSRPQGRPPRPAPPRRTARGWRCAGPGSGAAGGGGRGGGGRGGRGAAVP